MGILKKAATHLKYERGQNYELGHSMSSSAVSALFGTGGSAINVLEEYNGYAWKAINVRADLLADQDLFVERLVGNKWQEDVNHPFNLVLEGGDGQSDQSELLEAHEKSKMIYGESFWYFSKGETSSKPYSVYLLNPSAMTVLVTNNRVTGYVYQNEGNRALFDLDEIAHFKIHDPRNPFRGSGPMQAAGWFVRSSRYITTYVNNLLENNAIPAGALVVKGAVNDTDWKLFQEQWLNKYAGIDNVGKTAFIRGEGLDFVKTGLSLGEIDFEKMRNTSRDDVMLMFGISKPMFGIFDDINRASALTARQLAALMLTSPEMRRLKRKLSKKVALWYGKQYRVGGTNPIPEDDEAKLNKHDKLTGRAFTINETRAEYGYAPIPGGDSLPALDTPPLTPSKSIGTVTIKSVRKNHKGEYSVEMKESFRSRTEDLQLKAEQEYFQRANKVLTDQKGRVMDQIRPKKLVDAHLNADEEARKLADETLSIFIGLAKEQGALAAIFAGNEESTFKLTPVMEKYIQDSVFKASLGLTEDTLQKIADELASGINAGESIAQIGKRINAIYDEVLGVETPGYRIERLARTEIIKTSNEITEAAYRESGVVSKKEWFANPGRCEFCASLHGSIIQLGAAFVPLGSRLEGTEGGTRLNDYEDIKHPPVHPQCRCTLIPVIDED